MLCFVGVGIGQLSQSYKPAMFVIGFAGCFIMDHVSMQWALVCVFFSLFYVFYDADTNVSVMLN